MSLPTRIFPLVLFIAISGLCTHARGELDFTAELAPVAGLPGYESYRITATSDLGNIVGFDFSSSGSYGITGSMNQLSPFGQPTIFKDSMFASALDPTQDSHFLFNCRDVVSLFPEESSTALHSAFALIGDKQLTIGNSVPFVQIVTPSAADVFLKGSLVIRRSDDSYIQLAINTKLADIALGPAPSLTVIPVPPPEPVVTPQPPAIPVIETPPSRGPAPPAQPLPVVTPPPVSDPTIIYVPPDIVVTPIEPVQPYLPDVLLGYVPSFPRLPLTPEQLQALLIDRLDPVRIAIPPLDGNYGLINVFTYSEDSDSTLATVQIAQFNANYGLASAMGRNLEMFNASNTSAVPEPSTCVLILLGTAGCALTSLQRRRD